MASFGDGVAIFSRAPTARWRSPAPRMPAYAGGGAGGAVGARRQPGLRGSQPGRQEGYPAGVEPSRSSAAAPPAADPAHRSGWLRHARGSGARRARAMAGAVGRRQPRWRERLRRREMSAVAVFDGGASGALAQRPGTAGCVAVDATTAASVRRARPGASWCRPNGETAYAASRGANAVAAFDRTAQASSATGRVRAAACRTTWRGRLSRRPGARRCDRHRTSTPPARAPT